MRTTTDRDEVERSIIEAAAATQPLDQEDSATTFTLSHLPMTGTRLDSDEAG